MVSFSPPKKGVFSFQQEAWTHVPKEYMLLEAMLFLIKAEAGAFECNSDPLESWRLNIV